MDARLIYLPGLALAALSAGCVGTRPAIFDGGGPPPAGAAEYAARARGGTAPADARTGAAGPLQGSSYAPPGTTAARPPADPRGAAGPWVTPASAQAPPPAAGLPPPNPAAQPGPPPLTNPAALSAPPGAVPDGAMAPGGGHIRAVPTATGARLGLGPNEVPADRVVELSEKVQAAKFENQALISRIRELEAVAAGRETSLFEAIREVEAASAEVSKARADLAALRAEVAAARDRLRQIEKEDVDTLKAVIAGLEKLLQVPPARPTAGREP